MTPPSHNTMRPIHDNPFEQFFDMVGIRNIEPIPLIGLKVAMPNERLWELHALEVAGTATEAERAEMDLLCATLEAQCDEEERKQ